MSVRNFCVLEYLSSALHLFPRYHRPPVPLHAFGSSVCECIFLSVSSFSFSLFSLFSLMCLSPPVTHQVEKKTPLFDAVEKGHKDIAL